MKNTLVIFLFFLTFLGVAQNNKYIKIPKEYNNYPLENFIHEVEMVNNIHFYYKPEWISSINVNFSKDSIKLDKMMNSIFLLEKVGYYISKSGNLYLLPFKNITTKLPHFEIEASNKNEELEGIQNEDQFIESRDANSKTTLIIGNQGSGFSYRRVKVVGYLTDAETGDALVGTTIYIKDLDIGAASDFNGKVIINLKPGTYTAIFQSLGMREIKSTLIVYSEGDFELQMYKQSQSLNEIIVSQKTDKRGSNSGMESVSFLTMKEIPSLLGEKDVLKIAQMLPGIVSVGEGSGGINVRGGNADQNLFYVNSIPVYNSSHLFGFFTSINSNIVEKFNVYKGQVPVNYGGRLSSVFNVETRNGNKNKIFTEGAVSPISANIVLELPIVRNKASLSMSTRSTYSNWILGQMKDPTLRNSKASFYDLSLGFDYSLSDNDNLNVFAYYSNDYFSLNQLTDYSYGNSGASLRYVHRFSNKVKITGYFINSSYQFGTIEQNIAVESYKHNYTIKHNELKAELEWKPNDVHQITFGGNSILYNLNRGTIEPYGSESIMRQVPLGDEAGNESAIFLGDKITLGSRLELYGGLHYSFFNVLGPKKVYSYREGSEMNERNIVDSTFYQSIQKITTYHGPEVRAGLDFKTSINGTVKLTFNEMRQYLFMLSNTIAIAPTDQWKLVDSHIKPQHSIQYSLGYYHDFPMQGILASAEIYRKQSSNIVEYKDGANFLSTPHVESTILQGEQQAYGAEFMISKETGYLNGWVSYTYSSSIISVKGDQDWENINLGRSYRSNYDKPHVLNLVLNYKVNRRFSLSSNIVYNTGRPITLPIAYYFVEGEPFIDYSARNEYRIPDYFRMDFSVKIEGNLKKRKAIHSYWMFSVYNAAGRHNANSVFFKSEDNIIRGYQYSIIGVPIYTISWNWKLGNYENK